MNITGTLYTSNRKFEGQSQSFHACEERSISQPLYITTRVRFGFKKKMGSSSEGSISVIFISMMHTPFHTFQSGSSRSLFFILTLRMNIYRLGSSPSLKGLKIAMHASGQKRRENMREK
jgi:hypothetical protein